MSLPHKAPSRDVWATAGRLQRRWWNTERLIAETVLLLRVCELRCGGVAELKGSWESGERGARGVQGEGGV